MIAGVGSGCGCFGFSQDKIAPTNSKRGIRFKRILIIIGYQSAVLLCGVYVVKESVEHITFTNKCYNGQDKYRNYS